jgi:membrane complex biogenesis BtpA family protein
MTYRKYLRTELNRNILIFSDVHTKHGTPLHHQTITDATIDLTNRACPDGIIVTGRCTGLPPSTKDLKDVYNHASTIPVLVGSGVNHKNISKFFKYAHGFIVGTYFKKDGQIKNPVEIKRVKKLVELNEDYSK